MRESKQPPLSMEQWKTLTCRGLMCKSSSQLVVAPFLRIYLFFRFQQCVWSQHLRLTETPFKLYFFIFSHSLNSKQIFNWIMNISFDFRVTSYSTQALPAPLLLLILSFTGLLLHHVTKLSVSHYIFCDSGWQLHLDWSVEIYCHELVILVWTTLNQYMMFSSSALQFNLKVLTRLLKFWQYLTLLDSEIQIFG